MNLEKAVSSNWERHVWTLSTWTASGDRPGPKAPATLSPDRGRGGRRRTIRRTSPNGREAVGRIARGLEAGCRGGEPEIGEDLPHDRRAPVSRAGTGRLDDGDDLHPPAAAGTYEGSHLIGSDGELETWRAYERAPRGDARSSGRPSQADAGERDGWIPRGLRRPGACRP